MFCPMTGFLFVSWKKKIILYRKTFGKNEPIIAGIWIIFVEFFSVLVDFFYEENKIRFWNEIMITKLVALGKGKFIFERKIAIHVFIILLIFCSNRCLWSIHGCQWSLERLQIPMKGFFFNYSLSEKGFVFVWLDRWSLRYLSFYQTLD